jgi:hypothetical protein
MNLTRRIYRDPNSDAGGGAAAAAAAGAGTGAGAGEGGAGAGAGAATPNYLTKEDFGAFQDRLGSQLGSLSQKFDGHMADYSRRFAPNPPAGGESDKAPVLESYPGTPEGIQKFLSDHAKFHAGAAIAAHQTASDKKNKEQAFKAKRQTSVQDHVKRMGEARGRYKDFDQVVNNANFSLPDGTNGQPDVLGSVLESEFSGELHYHFASPAGQGDLFKLINAFNQSESAGARALGKLEARFERESEERKRTQRQARSAATGNAGGDAEGGEAGDDAKFEDMARSSWGLKGKKKE